jgi:hypothetical protein
MNVPCEQPDAFQSFRAPSIAPISNALPLHGGRLVTPPFEAVGSPPDIRVVTVDSSL